MGVHEKDLRRIRKKKKKRGKKMNDLKKELYECLNAYDDYRLMKSRLRDCELKLSDTIKDYLKEYEIEDVICFLVDGTIFENDDHIRVNVLFRNRVELEKAKRILRLFKKFAFDNGETCLGRNVYLTRLEIDELLSDLKKEEK